ncbi:TRAF family member-associated NF-kappa-B activator isoform X5 [Rattus norvegicus]|uniref:TRAF family member-associated NF-kappa-B activator isoform X5 n=1 Tax=Rattus norvegicus TaxID=10116 RepID=UPI0019171A1A|nr:TRAF family member-associated NF-kappa-B activator isoform X5 [Rattus norvegicus]
MDKNIGEQLNRAYEAFRQACMDRDSAVRELQQKQTENYEQRIREQQEQLSFQQTLIDRLKSQLRLVDSSRDNTCDYVPLLEDSDRRKNNLTLDEPHDKVKLGTLRDKQSKVRRQEVSSGKETSKDLSIPLHHERDNIEKTFWDLKEEFHRICLLAKAQKDHLSKLNIPDIATDTQCSVPIQCTDKTEKQEALFKPQAKDDINRAPLEAFS